MSFFPFSAPVLLVVEGEQTNVAVAGKVDSHKTRGGLGHVGILPPEEKKIRFGDKIDAQETWLRCLALV